MDISLVYPWFPISQRHPQGSHPGPPPRRLRRRRAAGGAGTAGGAAAAELRQGAAEGHGAAGDVANPGGVGDWGWGGRNVEIYVSFIYLYIVYIDR